MTHLVERLAELRRHVDHLRHIRDSVQGPETLYENLSVHNDVLFSLLMVAQLVVDISGELSTRRGLRFGDYTEAVRNLYGTLDLDAETVRGLERLPGFRNVVIHEYVALDFGLVVQVLDNLGPVERFVAAVARAEREGGTS